MPTKLSDLSDDKNFDSRITAAKAQADKGVEDAAAADAKAVVNAAAIEGHATRLGVLEEAKADHLQRISDLEAHDEAHTAEFNTLSGTVSGHTTAIANLEGSKANASDLNGAISRIAVNEGDIKTLKETTIPAINAEIAKKADATALADYYTKSEVGTIAEGKTLVKMIEEAQTAATYDDTEVRGLISAEVARAGKAEEDLGKEIARVEGVLNAALENEGEGLDSIKELAAWIEEHGKDASAMAKGIEDNAAAIAAINHETTGILAVAKAYTDAEIAGLPAATAEALGLVKFDDATIKMNESNQLYVAKVSTDVLEQGSQTLVLNGGSAKE